jgi:hypothetical protein
VQVHLVADRLDVTETCTYVRGLSGRPEDDDHRRPDAGAHGFEQRAEVEHELIVGLLKRLTVC